MSLQIVTFKVASGEEVIGRLEAHAHHPQADELGVNNYVVLTKVRVLAPMQSPNGQIQVALMPFSFANHDAPVAFQVENIVSTPTGPSTEVEESYLQQTSSIQLAR